MLGNNSRARQRGDHGKARADQRCGVEGGFCNADDRRSGQLTRGVQAGVAEAGDDVGVDAIAFAGANFIDHAKYADGFVKVAFDGHGAAARLGRADACAGCCDSCGGGADGIGHRLGGIGVDNAYMHAGNLFVHN